MSTPTTDFTTFATQLERDEALQISPQWFINQMCINQVVLARSAHVTASIVQKAPSSDRLQSYLRDAIRVIAAATKLVGNNNAVFWFKYQPIEHFDYKVPEMLVSEGRTKDVLGYIEQLAAGSSESRVKQ